MFWHAEANKNEWQQQAEAKEASLLGEETQLRRSQEARKAANDSVRQTE